MMFQVFQRALQAKGSLGSKVSTQSHGRVGHDI
jgi:hypothetical protein